MMQKRMAKKNKKSSTHRIIMIMLIIMTMMAKMKTMEKVKTIKKRFPPGGRYRMDPGHRYREAPHFGFGTRNA